jgi:hypothetical protein
MFERDMDVSGIGLYPWDTCQRHRPLANSAMTQNSISSASVQVTLEIWLKLRSRSLPTFTHLVKWLQTLIA